LKYAKYKHLQHMEILGKKIERRDTYFNNLLTWILKESYKKAPGEFYSQNELESNTGIVAMIGCKMELITYLLRSL
jgi:hypothetical protein